MNGMKEGVGDNPFERDDLLDEDENETDKTEAEALTASSDPTTTESRTSESDSGVSEPSPTASKQSIPYIYRRNRVTDEREQVSFYLREETFDLIEERLVEFETLLDEDVNKIDFRELALLGGVDHLDEM